MSEQPTNTQHTPGPWKRVQNRPVESMLAVVHHWYIDIGSEPAKPTDICPLTAMGNTPEECLANAAIGEAAPVMLAALEEALTLLEVYADKGSFLTSDGVQTVRNAIAKATNQGKE